MITTDAEQKIQNFNQIGLHYNLVAEGIYKMRSSLDSPFNQNYIQYIIAGLISFEMERMMGPNRKSRYGLAAGGFAALLAEKLEYIRPLIFHLAHSKLTELDIEKERKNLTTAYAILAGAGEKGLNQRFGEFHVGATKILHFLNPDTFLIIDSNAARAFKKSHDIKFRNTTQPGYTNSKYIACMKCAQQDIIDFGVDSFRNLEPKTPLARIYDKLTFITGSEGR
jgi:hypothetical protein